MNENENVFRIFLLVIYILGWILRYNYTRQTHNNRSIRSVNATREGTMYRIGVTVYLLPFLYALTPWLDFAQFPLFSWIRWVGYGIMLLSLVVLVASHQALGKNWSGKLDIREQHTLVTKGIYTYIRHPMYLSFLLNAVGTTLFTANALLGIFMLGYFFLMYLNRVDQEEQMMMDTFGDSYRQYMRHTGRLLPKLK